MDLKDSSTVNTIPHRSRNVFDWLSQPQPDDLTPFQHFIRGLDWDRSPLGPIQEWPAQLRQMVLLIVEDPDPAVVHWGDNAIIVYNEAYTQLIGRKHPALQGQDPRIEFAEIWDYFADLLAKQRETAKAVVEKNAFLLLFRHGFLEETYFNWKIVPMIGDEGWVVGSHATVAEVTREVISDRRTATLKSLRRHLSKSTDIKDLWDRVIAGLLDADKDIPLAMLYSVPGDRLVAGDDAVTENAAMDLHLEGSVGLPDGHSISAPTLDIVRPITWLGQLVEKAITDMTVVLKTLDDECRAVLDGIDWRGHGSVPKQIVACPIIPTDSNSVLAVLVVAINPHRPFDNDYREFIDLLIQQVTVPRLLTIILREEVERRRTLAVEKSLDRDRLHLELSEAETKLARMISLAPVGLAILTPDGFVMSANELWCNLTQLGAVTQKVCWNEVFCDSDSEAMDQAWRSVVAGKRAVMRQMRLRQRWRAPNLDANGNVQYGETHILLAIHPDLDDFGEVKSVMSCMTDISSMIWSESQLQMRMDEVVKMKKEQEVFIDMTSHEIRNPLSALIGCADEIISSLRAFQTVTWNAEGALMGEAQETAQKPVLPKHFGLLDEAIEAAQMILHCAMHQKRIVDDVLTLSRLDSSLLLVSPEPTRPVPLLREALKIFHAELKRGDTELCFVEEDSLQALQVQWILLDPVRTLQVLFNLMTNAIKFTRARLIRRITVSVGASLDKPSESHSSPEVRYIKRSPVTPDQTLTPEWGHDEVVYLCVSVQDTGQGLDENEIQRLFHLFAQASPKTYQKYGGSGLGLFICKQLVEMQGGEIGVASKHGMGSRFQFYVRTRRTIPPAVRPQGPDLQFLFCEDALRAACVDDISATLERKVSFESRVGKQRMATTTPTDTRRLHILVVEDNLINQKVLAKQLRKAGHFVYTANHGEEALAHIRNSEFWEGGEQLSIVLMDLEMPIMDGMRCIKRIRELQKEGSIKRHLPVIAVTANARQGQILMSIEAGMDDLAVKPYYTKDLLGQIDRILARYTIRAEEADVQEG